ncbi:unnamed protein product [Arabidopsis lyrata]|nr:unnamed protein product [Arabidopsis lyrata]
MDAKGENSLALFPSKFRERKYLQILHDAFVLPHG